MFARSAAIKLIRPEVIAAGDPAAMQVAVMRFRREAEAAANLRSPHTVELYDFGVTDDQTLYFVMELLEGMDLESLIQRHGPLPAGRMARILRQTCESLEEAHVGGLVHRDIKPANIHLGRLGIAYDFVKVLDFGLVKPVADKSLDQSLNTQAGLLLGTPGYMAPEMVLGTDVDGRADLYALGCVAYYLLTGTHVFDGSTAIEIVSKHLHALPVPPSTRSPFTIPPDLDQLILACLAKRPEDRPSSAAELARRLSAIDLESWTDAQAKAWWLALEPQSADVRPDDDTFLQQATSGANETRPE
jgi:eukaryotic-like serine/threonine-protein kinase